jgi:hypothetical protein
MLYLLTALAADISKRLPRSWFIGLSPLSFESHRHAHLIDYYLQKMIENKAKILKV